MPEDDEGLKTELQLQIEAVKIRSIQGVPQKIPDLDQWEKVTKYVEKKNLTKVPREDLDKILFTLWPYIHKIQYLESLQQNEIDGLKREIKATIARAKDEQEEALDVQEFLTRELQEKEEDINGLRREYEEFKTSVEHKHDEEIHALEDQLEEGASAQEFMQREIEYAEQKLAGMEGGENQSASKMTEELNQLRRDKVASQKDSRDLRKELKDLVYEMKLNTTKTAKLQEERDEALDQAANVKDTIKSEVDQLEEEVSRELAAKDQEILEFVGRNEELERHGERLEQKINFLIKENSELEARDDVGHQPGMTPRTPRTARPSGGGGGILQEEQLEFAREQITGLESRNSEMKVMLDEAQAEGTDKVNELKDQIAQMIVDTEELHEKAEQSDQLQEWVTQLGLEKEDDRLAADQEIGELKANFHTEKLIAIEAAVVDMKERNADMEHNIEDVDYQRITAEENLVQCESEIAMLKDEMENLEVLISELKVKSRSEGGQSDSRETGALKKQLKALTKQRDSAMHDAEQAIQQERLKFADKINELEKKFNEQMAEHEDEEDVEHAQLQVQLQVLDKEKLGILNMNLALAKQLREKEVYINNVEYAVSDMHLQLKNAVQDQHSAEDEKARIEQSLEELLELQEEHESEWKENAQIISLTSEVEDLKAHLEGIEEERLDDLEQMTSEKSVELENVIQAMKKKYETIIEEKDEELESLLNDNEEELMMLSRELNSKKAMDFMKKTCRELLLGGQLHAIAAWSKNCSMASMTGVERLLEIQEEKIKEYESQDKARLQELRLTVQNEVTTMREKMAVDKETTRAAQAQTLFMTTMVAKQLAEAYGATGIALLCNMLNMHHKHISVACFYHWKETMAPSGAVSQSDTGSPAPKSMLRNVLRNAEYQQQNVAQMEHLIVEELQATMMATAQNRFAVTECNRLRNSKETQLSSMDSVHELELNAKRKSEKEWMLEKNFLEQELDVLKRKTDIEMGLFNQIQGTMHAEKRAIAEKLDAAESELSQTQLALTEAKSKGAEGIHIARGEHVNVSFKTGFWKLCWLFSTWNKTIITGNLRIWNNHTIDAKCAAIATTKQEHSCLKEQFEISQHQYALTTSALRESLSRLSKERAIDKASMILKRNTSQVLGSTLARWYANKVRFETTYDASTQAHAVLEANQKQMGLRNHELWITLMDSKEKQMQIGMKTLHSIFSRFHKLACNGSIRAWRRHVQKERQKAATRSLKLVGGIKKLVSVFSSLGMMAIQKAFMTLKSQFDDLKHANLTKMRIALNKVKLASDGVIANAKAAAAASEERVALIEAKAAAATEEERVAKAEAKAATEAAEERVAEAEAKAAAVAAQERVALFEAKAAAAAAAEENLAVLEARKSREIEESAQAAFAAGQVAMAKEHETRMLEEAAVMVSIKGQKATAPSLSESPRESTHLAGAKSLELLREEVAIAIDAFKTAADGDSSLKAREQVQKARQAIKDEEERLTEGQEQGKLKSIEVLREELAIAIDAFKTAADGDSSLKAREQVQKARQAVKDEEERLTEGQEQGKLKSIEVLREELAIAIDAFKTAADGDSSLKAREQVQKARQAIKDEEERLANISTAANSQDTHLLQSPEVCTKTLGNESVEILMLFDCLDQAESALREQIMDGQELEAEYQRLEIMFHSKTLRKHLDLEPRPLITQDETAKIQNEIMNNVAAQHDLQEVPEILTALSEIENALMEQLLDNQSLEQEIESLEAELSL